VGTHKNLLKKGGYYSNLYEAQFLAEEVAWEKAIVPIIEAVSDLLSSALRQQTR
jgi:hypothetical protein